MSNTVATLALQYSENSRRNNKRVVKVTFSAGDYVAGGIPLDLTGLTNPNLLPAAKFSGNPIGFEVMNGIGGFTLQIVPGTTLASGWKLRIYQSDDAVDPLDELTGALPADVTSAADVRLAFTGKPGIT